MQLRTFSATTMAEALVQVKREMGGDAVILHTRTYHRRRWLGLRRVEVVEITAGNGLNAVGGRASRPRSRTQPIRQVPTATLPARPVAAGSSSGGGTLAALAASHSSPVAQNSRH